jgi:hypothetical protein
MDRHRCRALCITVRKGCIAQLVEHWAFNLMVAGSSPAIPIAFVVSREKSNVRLPHEVRSDWGMVPVSSTVSSKAVLPVDWDQKRRANDFGF